MIRPRLIGVAAAIALAAGAVAMTMVDMDLTWERIAGGGTMFSTGESYVMGATIGLPDATAPDALSGGSYELTGGFWVADTVGSEGCAGDQNGDGVIDYYEILMVLGHWGRCPPPPGVCVGDVNDDGFVDYGDVLMILSNWGCGAGESATFDETLELAGVRPEEWDVFEHVMEDDTSLRADGWRCWMARRLATLDDDLRDLPDCAGEDPLSGYIDR